MSEVVTVENAALERDAWQYENTLARLGSRRKYDFCRQCGSEDRMQKVHRDTLAGMRLAPIIALDWYAELGNDAEYLFCPCPVCNPDKIIPDLFEALSLADVLDWPT